MDAEFAVTLVLIQESLTVDKFIVTVLLIFRSWQCPHATILLPPSGVQTQWEMRKLRNDNEPDEDNEQYGWRDFVWENYNFEDSDLPAGVLTSGSWSNARGTTRVHICHDGNSGTLYILTKNEKFELRRKGK